ncbi:MAG: malonate decarboxylase subunit alpha, partial [Verrucomicrobia bacterium]|nr:malonate decarboxylase subunit alpha [Verrucomicrobiota bacterium]
MPKGAHLRSSWSTRRQKKAERIAAARNFADGQILAQETIVQALETLVLPGDRVAIEGNNQKQADFLSRALAQADSQKLHDLHLLISSVSRPEHLDL